MAADYARITSRFWTGRTGRELRAAGPDAQVVALYLLTCSHRSPLGLYHLPIDTIAFETGRGFEGASKGLARTLEAGFAKYDYDHEVVWVPGMAGVQVADSLEPKDNRIKWIRKACDELRKFPFYKDFLERWGKAFHCDDITPKPAKAPSPLQAPSKALVSQPNSIPSQQHPNSEKLRDVEGESPREGTAPKPKRRAAARHLFPTDFQPNDADRARARELGISVEPEVAKCIDHHRGKGTLVADDHATFRTWLTKAKEFAPRQNSPRVNELPGSERSGAGTTGGLRRVNARDDPRLGAASPASRNVWTSPPPPEENP